ncbi:MAG: hypothetical protein F6K01_34550, partial [Okeania sp. SIO1I7]|nr:hypothetical protein [Okeania sp. SIO1I7]
MPCLRAEAFLFASRYIYQPKVEVVEPEVKPTAQTEIKRQTWKIPDIEVSRKTIDNIMV